MWLWPGCRGPAIGDGEGWWQTLTSRGCLIAELYLLCQFTGGEPSGSRPACPDHPLPAPACRAGHCQIDSLKLPHYTLVGSPLLVVGCYRDGELSR